MASFPASPFPASPWAASSTSLSSPAAAASFSGISFPPKSLKFHFAPLASSFNDGASAKETEARDRVQLAFSKAKAYRENKISSPSKPLVPAQKPSDETPAGAQNRNVSETEAPIAVKLALEKAKEYKRNKEGSSEEPRVSGGEAISSGDFPGPSISENKSNREKTPGFVTPAESLPEGDVREAKIIVGDKSKFERNTLQVTTSSEVDDDSNLYKPKVSTWGVFPRPKNISKTFGGGRVIPSGEMLETPETREAKEKQSRELISAYKGNTGSILIDAKTQAECEKALKDGDILMDMGQLKGALPYYEKVMKNLVFETELYGLAALQWSICQDSLSRSNEAKVMYEKLQSHSKAEVRKQARQFMFSFQAMEMMNVRDTSYPKDTGFEDYFEAFIDNEAGYAPAVDEPNGSVLEEAFPYLIFLLSPIFIIIFVVIKRSF